jgi:hypothetical protein
VRTPRAARTLSLAILALAAGLLLPGSGGALIQAGAPGVSILAQNGFGERDNSYAWSMSWFNGKLYVGTGRDEQCVEEQTLQHYFPLLNAYSTNPSTDVRCPPNAYKMDLRAEIWQYTPQAHSWRMVYRAPATQPNPQQPSQRVASDIGYRGMVEYSEPHGRSALFAAGLTADEYLPRLLVHHPPRILRSFDGVHWKPLLLPSVVVHFPGGNVRPMGFRSLLVWKRRLFVTATPDLTGDGALFEVTRLWSKHPGLVQVSPRTLDIFEIAQFDGDLYLGCGSAKSGYSVWRTDGRHGFHFTPVVTGGAGRGSVMTSVVSMHVYRDRLYVGASGWYNQNTLPLSELIRIQSNGSWTLVVGNPRTLPSGRIVYPISGLNDGFDSLFNSHFWRMAVQAGGLYLGTNNWAYLIKTDAKYAWFTELITGALGYQLWVTCDGVDWFPVTRDAFGIGEYDFGARTLQPAPNGQSLYVGSADQAQGTKIVVDNDPVCSSLVNVARRVAPPRALVADAGRRGTLLSWEPSRSAKRYEVLAAAEHATTLYLKAPPTMPSGFQSEGATPKVVDPGTAGGVPVTLTVPGGFEPVASTSSSHYVAHRRGKYVYTVVAENAAGEASGPSNIQLVPEPEPPPTFGSVALALSPSRATVARADGGSQQQRLLAAAQAAWHRGDRARALREIQRLGAVSAQNEQLSALIVRLQRALQYSQVPGA